MYLLPKPIAGIPYNPSALKSIFGDIPAMVKNCNGSPMRWMVSQGQRRNSPIFQVFVMPFAKPSVVVSDFREAQDILMRRKEFDRSDFTIALSSEIPQFHINLKTGPEWKAHRRLLQDLMTPAFLSGVAAPNIYESAPRPDIGDSGFVQLAWWWKRLQPRERRLMDMRAEFVKDQVARAVEKLQRDADEDSESWVKSAIDLVIHRERKFAKKEGREPVYWSPIMKDEVLRLAHTAPVVDWQCTRDTEVLGRRVPAGTVVLLPNLGPSFTSPDFKIDEALRSETSRARLPVLVRGRRRYGRLPAGAVAGGERGDGRGGVRRHCGPAITFGLKTRGCFGRKLAYLELRLIVTLIIWNFELLPCYKEISSYDSIEGITSRPRQCYVILRSVAVKLACSPCQWGFQEKGIDVNMMTLDIVAPSSTIVSAKTCVADNAVIKNSGLGYRYPHMYK
ncbi:cytochrome P450 [Colletotrichum cereale]|nr:cytochrome P450 [Colletotrichum cereale]